MKKVGIRNGSVLLPSVLAILSVYRTIVLTLNRPTRGIPVVACLCYLFLPDQIVGADKDDEALEKYKRDLLGDVSNVAIVDEANPRY